MMQTAPTTEQIVYGVLLVDDNNNAATAWNGAAPRAYAHFDDVAMHKTLDAAVNEAWALYDLKIHPTSGRSSNWDVLAIIKINLFTGETTTVMDRMAVLHKMATIEDDRCREEAEEKKYGTVEDQARRDYFANQL